MKLHEWAAEIDPRGIYQSAVLAHDLEQETRKPAPLWLTYPAAEVLHLLDEEVPPGTLMVTGCEAQRAVAQRHCANATDRMDWPMGRGKVGAISLELLSAANV